MPRTCTCNDLENCSRCRAYETDPRYAAWALLPTRAGSCRHKGEEVRRHPCGTCAGKVELKVFACKIHGECTAAKPLPGVACCQGCPDHETVSAASQKGGGEGTAPSPPSSCVKPPHTLTPLVGPRELTELTSVEAAARLFASGPVGPFPAGWAGWDNVRLAHIALLEDAVARPSPYPEGRFHGRGIVTCVSAKPGWSSGKNLPHGYFPGAWVLVKELRRLGCTLPITFAHLGPLEWDPQLTRLVRPLGVEVLDLEQAARADPMRILAGWETKVFALQHAPYQEVLFLDADNVPVRNPTFLFDNPHYRDTGAVFWPDLPPHDRAEWLPEVVWKNVGMKRQNSVDFESGQLLVDKRRCWRELYAARHLNEHSDWYYHFVFGDKSTFHLAWAKCGRRWSMPATPAGWLHPCILQHDFGGRVLFHHACQDKPSRDGYAFPGRLPNQSAADGHLAELRRLWSGRLWVNDEPSPADRAAMGRLRGRLLDYERVGLGSRRLRLLEDDRVGLGGARCEFGWSVLEGVLALTDVDGRPTLLAREGPDGVWRGRWLEHERCDVVLTPLAHPVAVGPASRNGEAAAAPPAA